MAKLLYMGRNSFRIIGARGTVVYVDPYAGDDYDIPADLILVTHQHSDHNAISKVARKPECLVIQNYEALEKEYDVLLEENSYKDIKEGEKTLRVFKNHTKVNLSETRDGREPTGFLEVTITENYAKENGISVF